jgi:chromosome segregation protein
MRAGDLQFAKLRLTGFKSFVDPTELVIQDGLTGVVGPNGCGKSNLLEALRWVMGENRPTAMRGAGMEDVIFAGAASRPARHFAEVALHLDNSERLAPAGFNDSDQIDIIRRITRDAGSAYKLNGKDARARDVQILFADASTGAHSPALVRQGQISELINARPKARRRILEEAAGIAGLYQRRHEAELRLKAAETNLTRLDDTLDALAAQLATLARQAKQAERYRVIAAEIRQNEGMLLFLRWQDASAVLEQTQQDLRAELSAAAQAETAARHASTARDAAEQALPPLQEEDTIAAAILQRLMVERDSLQAEAARAGDAIKALETRAAQLASDLTREQALNADAETTIARLKSEQANLADRHAGHRDRMMQAQTHADAASHILAERESDLAQLTEFMADLAARHQAAQRQLAEAQKNLTHHMTELRRAETAARDGRDRLTGLAQTQARSAQAVQTALQAALQAETDLAQAETARSDLEQIAATARSNHAEAKARFATLQSEVQAVARLVQSGRGKGPQILDELRADKGFEAALAAALADDLQSPRAPAPGQTGWSDLAPYPQTPPLPDGARALADFVTAPPLLARRLSQVGVVAADQGPDVQPDLQPGQRLVSAQGDLWRWDGYAMAAKDMVSGAARHLQQVNRLADLETELAGAEADFTKTQTAHDALAAQLADMVQIEQTARDARRNADHQLAQARRTHSQAETDHNVLLGKLETLDAAVAQHDDATKTAQAQIDAAEAELANLDDLDQSRAQSAALKQQVETARSDMLAGRANLHDVIQQGKARERRMAAIEPEIENWTNRLSNAASQLQDLTTRQAAVAHDLETARAQPADIQARLEGLAGKITDAQTRKAQASDALSGAIAAHRAAITAERDAERAASNARENRAVAETRRDAAVQAQSSAAARIAEDHDMTPETLREDLGDLPDPLPSSDQIEGALNRLRRQRDALGAVNLRAAEDAQDIQTEFDTLTTEKADLEGAIAKLRAGIAALNRQGREKLLAAFDKVNTNFAKLFAQLFNGGEARLVLVESDDPLEAGLEILCQPPGKKLSTLSLLSGGEQTLTALALIFAVFLANPAPICVLDEVDAPLDDANVTRFCDLLDEMTRQASTRFLIITHHAVTMARMDRLFGVTMAEHGVSQLVSVDLSRAEKMVA